MIFAGKAWRLLVGIKDGLVLVFMLLFFAALFFALKSSPDPRANRGGALLLALSGSIAEQPEAADPRDVLTGAAPTGEQFRLRDVLQALEAAKGDDDIKTVVLDLDGFAGGGQVDLQRIGLALDGIRAAKKPVLAFATGYSDDAYLLAAHSSEVWLDPMGAVFFTGPGGSQPYFKGLADRLGVNVHVYRVGKYKSFVEPYIRDAASPEAKQESQVLADALWEDWQADVNKARPKAKVVAMAGDPVEQVTAAKGDLAKAALANGIVDKLADRTAFGARVAQLAGNDDEDTPGAFNSSELSAYVDANPESTSGDEIGIITVAGEIVDGEAPAGSAGGDTIVGLLHSALSERDLKALVLRVDSPGGSAFAAEQIRRALLEVKAAKIPVVVSMGNVAASGGYWVAMTGDKVIAEPSTITGSIGVFSILPTFERTAAKIGVTSDGVVTTPLSGQPDLLRGTNAAGDAMMQAGVEDIYRRFTEMVAEKRKLPLAKVQEIAQGRVWSGGAARQLGLVDQFGGIDEAVVEAAKLAKLESSDAQRVYLETQSSWFDGLLGRLIGVHAKAPRTDAFTHMIHARQGKFLAALRDASRIAQGPAIQVRCTECPVSAPAQQWRAAPPSFLSYIFQSR